jgi:hypothetical protein
LRPVGPGGPWTVSDLDKNIGIGDVYSCKQKMYIHSPETIMKLLAFLVCFFSIAHASHSPTWQIDGVKQGL